MGIRDTSYYGWQDLEIARSAPGNEISSIFISDVLVDSSGIIFACGNIGLLESANDKWVIFRSSDDAASWETVDGLGDTSAASSLAIDSSGSIYAVGHISADWVVRKSLSGLSGTFTTVESLDRDGSSDKALGVAIDLNDNIYVCGYEGAPGESSNWIIRSSNDLGATFGYIDSVTSVGGKIDQASAITVDSSGNVYACGYVAVSTFATDWVVRKSSTGASGSFSDVDVFNLGSGSTFGANATDIVTDSSDNVYVCGYEYLSSESQNWIIRSSSDLGSTFGYIDSVNRDDLSDRAYGITVDSDDHIYACGYETVTGEGTNWILRKSLQGASGSFFYVDGVNKNNDADRADSVTVDALGNIYVIGITGTTGLLRRGKLQANSSSLGPSMLSPSFGYVAEEPVSGSLVEKFKLNNVSEYPHHSGLFQMPNMVLGTQSTGKIGNTEDSIIQVKYRGSVVSVMWPKQADQSVPVAGFGDFAAGQRSGKLTTAFDPGDFIDVTEFDHMTLYCYLLKDVSGTLDNIDLQIERRPLKSTPFSVDQVIEYESSGSATLANMKDLIYRKSIDYGDLSIKEIGYPIDVPLTNVREIRVACKQQIGQVEEKNKNLVVWGRFIRSEEGET